MLRKAIPSREDVVFLVAGRTIKHGAEGHRVTDNDEDDALE